MKEKSWVDDLDTGIIPYVKFPNYEDRYPTLSIQKFPYGFYEELRETSSKLFNIFCRVTKLLQTNSENILKDLDIPEKIFPYLNIENRLGLPSWLSRFDYVLDKDSNLKMIEINADTPCAIPEAYCGNKIACNYFAVDNPNNFEERQLESLLNKLFYGVIPREMDGFGNFNEKHPMLFSCFHDYIEDLGNTMYLKNLIGEHFNKLYGNNIIFESFYNLMVDDKGLLLPSGQRPYFLYRMHPIELLIEERSEDSTDIGLMLLDRYKEHKFVMMNPPESIIMQNKGFLALVWNLSNVRNTLLSEDDIEIIHKYMLPAYLDFEEISFKIGDRYIQKPIYGREGCGIKIVDIGSNVLEYTEESNYDVTRLSKNYLYQKFIDSPVYEHLTDSGSKKGYLTLSCFMVGDKPSAVYGRFSESRICGNDAYWLPLGY